MQGRRSLIQYILQFPPSVFVFCGVACDWSIGGNDVMIGAADWSRRRVVTRVRAGKNGPSLMPESKAVQV